MDRTGLDQYRPFTQYPARPVQVSQRGAAQGGRTGRSPSVSWPTGILRHDIRRPLPFSSSQVDAIYSSHALEPVYLGEARAILAECRRTLRPGGMIRPALPGAEAMARQLIATRAHPDSGAVFNQDLNSYPDNPPGFLRTLRGTVSSPPHRWQPTEGLVRTLLDTAGFTDVRRQQFQEGDFPDLVIVEHRRESLFLEAVSGGSALR